MKMTTPLFLSMVKDDYETDFGLFNMIQSLKYKVFRPLFTTPNLPPVVLVPGLGASKIYARWNKNGIDTNGTAKFLDGAGVFETSSEWNCRTLQSDFIPLWEPNDYEGAAKYCWANNLHVNYDSQTGEVVNAPGVTTYVGQGWDLATNCYHDFIKSFEAAGYQKDANLYCAQYDFRRICGSILREYLMELQALIETAASKNGGRVVLIGHDLGSQIANYFLVQMPKEWKDAYIKEFVIVSGTFGGVPKALRTLLSGTGEQLERETYRHFCGLLWMLPCPMIYGDLPLVRFRNIDYTAKNIEQLLRLARYNDTYELYSKHIHSLQVKSMQAPGVPVSIYSGNEVPTESNYVYGASLTDSPEMEEPVQDNELGERRGEIYPSNFNGDGTSPKFVLEHPVQWSRYQREPVRYFFYNWVSHEKVLSRKDSVMDILGGILET
jgi:hypothetical protein